MLQNSFNFSKVIMMNHEIIKYIILNKLSRANKIFTLSKEYSFVFFCGKFFYYYIKIFKIAEMYVIFLLI
jgi:hypothetical protein